MPMIDMKGMKRIPQETTATCWLAAYQMMFTWKGLDTSLPLQLLKSRTDVDVSKAVNEGLDAPDWPKAARAFRMWAVAGGEFSDEWFKGTLKDFGPMLVHGKFELGMHSIVVIGWEENFWGTVQMAWYLNPFWEGTKDIKPRCSSIKWLRDGVKRNQGRAAVIQYWTPSATP